MSPFHDDPAFKMLSSIAIFDLPQVFLLNLVKGIGLQSLESYAEG